MQDDLPPVESLPLMPDLEELLALHGAQFVTCAYRRLLVREPDESGMALYLRELAAGTPKIVLLDGMASSKEGRVLDTRPRGLARAVRLYRLGRIPVIGALVRRWFRVEGSSAYEHRLRALEQRLQVPAVVTAPSAPRVWPTVAAPPDLRALLRESGLFDPDWYRDQVPGIGNTDPLDHFLHHGMAEGRSPGPKFDCGLYGAVNRDVRRDDLDPLWHFLLHGRAQGRRCFPVASRTQRPAAIQCLLPPRSGGETALLVVHLATEPPLSHLLDCIGEMVRLDVNVVLVIVANGPAPPLPPQVLAQLSGAFLVPEARGDGVVWARIARLHPELMTAPVLYLVNDRLLEQVAAGAIAGLIGRIRASAADVVGLTDEQALHPAGRQHFIALKPATLSHPAWHRYLNSIDAAAPLQQMAGLNEVSLAALLHSRALSVEFLGDTATAGHVEPPRTVHPNGAGAAADQRHRVSLIGPLNHDDRAGQETRALVSALWHADLRVNLHPVRTPDTVPRHGLPTLECRSFAGDADVVIVSLNPGLWTTLLGEEDWAMLSRARKVVCVHGCDAERVPPSWQAGFGASDVVWAPNRYCADRMAELAEVPVEVMPGCIGTQSHDHDPGRRGACRAALGISAEQRLVVCCLEELADLTAEDPWSLIEAFEAAALAQDGWVLVLVASAPLDASPEARRLQDAAMLVPGLKLAQWDGAAASPDVWLDGWLAAADIYASAHRAQASGRTLARAMALGKAVVATDYGASRDFLDRSYGYPVGYALQILAEHHADRPAGSVWAVIDGAALATALRHAAADIVAGELPIAQRARERMAGHFSPASVGALLQRAVDRLMGS